MQRAISKVTVDDFDTTLEKGHALIYAIATDFYRDEGRMIPLELLYTNIQNRTLGHPDFDPNTIQSILNFAYQLFARPVDDKDLVPSWALDTMHSFLYQRRVAIEVVRKVEQYGTQMPDVLDELISLRTSAAVHQGTTVEPFASDEDEFLGTRPRTPMGVGFIDTLLGGGTREEEMYGFIAPSGGGKTSLSHQIGISCARQNLSLPPEEERRHTYIISYEESTNTNEYMIPVMACATGMPRDMFDKDKDRVLADMTEEQREIYRQARKEIGSYLHYVDFSGSRNNAGRGGAHEIDSYLIEQANLGRKVHGVIIDWMWPMFQRYFADYKVEREKMLQERGLCQQLMDDLKRVCERRKCWAWVNHQLAPSAANKKKPADWTDASELKSFAWLVNVCFTLGMLDENNIAHLNCSKNRANATSKVAVQLKGAISTFVPLSGEFKWSRRSKGYVRDGEENKVPDTRSTEGAVDSSPPSKERRNYEGIQVDV
jgi:hypothetical protein